MSVHQDMSRDHGWVVVTPDGTYRAATLSDAWRLDRPAAVGTSRETTLTASVRPSR